VVPAFGPSGAHALPHAPARPRTRLPPADPAARTGAASAHGVRGCATIHTTRTCMRNTGVRGHPVRSHVRKLWARCMQALNAELPMRMMRGPPDFEKWGGYETPGFRNTPIDRRLELSTPSDTRPSDAIGHLPSGSPLPSTSLLPFHSKAGTSPSLLTRGLATAILQSQLHALLHVSANNQPS
jgi:hypothetical protein